MAPTGAGFVLFFAEGGFSVEGSVLLLGIVVLAGFGTGVLFVISALAYANRRSTQYLLIMGAIGALFFRSLVGLGTVLGLVPMGIHHTIEHSLDFLIASVVLYAVYRNTPPEL